VWSYPNQTQLAFQLIKIELHLKAYQKLHHEELAQLWENLDACKQTIAALNHEIDLLDREMRITQPARLADKAESNGVEVPAPDSQLDKAGSTELPDSGGGNHASNGHLPAESSKTD
jgi:hypothetical protein